MKQLISTVPEGEKTYECNVCGSRFARNAHLKGHIEAVHEGAKPFKCEFCDVSFS
jgi:KRAB domain-containing zinc finger protein